MIRNYIKIAWRNLWKNKGFSVLNIIGLAVGMAVAVLILIMVQQEKSMDTFHHDLDRLFVLGNKGDWNDEVAVWFYTPKPLAPALKEEYPEIENVSRYIRSGDIFLSNGDSKFTPTGAIIDPDYLTMFNFPLLQGTKQTIFNNPSSIVLTQRLAETFFGNDQNIIGKTIKVNNSDYVTITGVLKDLPANTQFDFEYLLPWSYLKQSGNDEGYWGNNSLLTFAKLKTNADSKVLSHKIKNITKQHTEGDIDNEIILHKLSDWWLRSKFKNGKIAGGRIDMVNLFTIIACFILLIACINFMNLSTARSEKRAKEIGVRKVAGAGRSSLIWQFLCESILIATIAGILAIGIIIVSLPYYNTLLKNPIAIDFSNYQFWLFMITVILITGVLAGSYPAFLLSSFKPVKVLKGIMRSNASPINPRKVLVVVQFTIAIILIVSTLIINKQIQYGKDRENGYNKKNLVYVYEQGNISKNIDLIRNDLVSENIATSITRSFSPLTEGWSNTDGIEWEGKQPDDHTIFDRTYEDQSLVETAGLTLVAGRDINIKSFPSDSTAMLLNEAAANAIGFKDPIGKILRDNGKEWHVVGVVEDFITRSPFEPIAPIVIGGPAGWLSTLHIKFNKNLPTAEALAKTEKIFKEYNPDYPFEYHFIDEEYATKFAESQRTGTLSAIFAFLTIFISCLGLLGLASYMAENRTKEIGIRKTLGASVFSIVQLLSKDFLMLVILSCVIAFPIAYWAMNNFLLDYTYRISLGTGIFLIAGIGALLFALLIVSSQAIKAAIRNPVKSIRTE